MSDFYTPARQDPGEHGARQEREHYVHAHISRDDRGQRPVGIPSQVQDLDGVLDAVCRLRFLTKAARFEQREV
jgi:hypothetical protein